MGRILLREVLIKALVLNRHARNGKTNGRAYIFDMLNKAYEDDAYFQNIQDKLGEVQSLL